MPSGFDYMRILLACAIVFYHSFETSYGGLNPADVYASWWRPFGAAVLPMFFALSGFLVAGSLERTKNIFSFISLRVIRILPALSVEILLSAFLLGPLLTVFTLKEYFTDPQLYEYFGNLYGNVHYHLPGLFLNNPVEGLVNAQLWTLPVELYCYLGIIVIASLDIYRRSYLLLPLIAVWFAFVIYFVIFLGHDLHQRPTTVTEDTLMMASYSGMLCFRFRQHIPWHPFLFVISAGFSWWALAYPLYDVLAPLPLAYATVYIGLFNPARNKHALSGDYSYGIFLYGYPIQQAYTAIVSPDFHTWYWNLLFSMPVIFLVAMFSWFCVEKPALRLKKVLPGYKPVRH